MKRLINNIILLIVALLLLSTIGVYGLLYALVFTVFHYTKISFLKFWGDLLYSINVGIDFIGNVLLGTFLNNYAIVDKTKYPFGKINHTISHVLAYNFINLNNTTDFGMKILHILERIDRGHTVKSLKLNGSEIK
jgi:hypothetical protein